MRDLTPTQFNLLDGWQRGFPLVTRPYAVVAGDVGLSEGELLAELSRLLAMGAISRVGATLRPNTAGASLLAAMRVPSARLDEVAEIVNAEPGVNHNYEREHALNLWFVVTGADTRATDAALARIRERSGLDIVELPLVRSYYIDLGFPLVRGALRAKPSVDPARAAVALDATDRALLHLLEPGLPLVPEPYGQLAARLGMSEADVIGRLERLVEASVITRLGLIVRHRPLGFRANAMAVWDVPDDVVDEVGARLAAEPSVTLCYRRPRRGADWPYNMFCMVHGREREVVTAIVADLTRIGGLDACRHAVLFSRRCFRQRGASLRAA